MPLTASLTLCQYCDHANPADANFCIGCGAQLHLVPCPTCGAVNPKTSKTCYQCRSQLRESTEILLAHAPASASEVAAGNAESTALSAPHPSPPPTPQRQPLYVITIILVAFAAAAYFAYQQRDRGDVTRTTTETRTKNASEKTAESAANSSAGAINKGTIVLTAPPASSGVVTPSPVPANPSQSDQPSLSPDATRAKADQEPCTRLAREQLGRGLRLSQCEL